VIPPNSSATLFFRLARLPPAHTADLDGVLCPEIASSRAIWQCLWGSDAGLPSPLPPLRVTNVDRRLVRAMRMRTYPRGVKKEARRLTQPSGYARGPRFGG